MRSTRLLRSSATSVAAVETVPTPKKMEPMPKPKPTAVAAVETMATPSAAKTTTTTTTTTTAATATTSATTTSTTRKSPRNKQEVAKFTLRSDTIIRHDLLLGPTIARQAKKWRERARAEHIKRISQKMSPSQLMQSDAIRPANASGNKSSSSSSSTRNDHPHPINGAYGEKFAIGGKFLTKTPTKMKLSPATPITPDSVQSNRNNNRRSDASKKKNSKRENNNQSPVLDRIKNKNFDNFNNTSVVKKNAQNNKRKHSSASSSSSDDMNCKSFRYGTRGQTRRSRENPFPNEDDDDGNPYRLCADSLGGGRSIIDSQSKTAIKTRSKTRNQKTQCRDDPIARKVTERKQLATESLMMANDMTSIFAALWAFHQLHDDDDMDPGLFRLLSNNQETGYYLLTKLLLGKFTSPRSFGGLAFSDVNAHILINKIMLNFGRSFGALDITLKRLTEAGIPPLVAEEIRPHLSCIVNETRTKIHFLFKQIMDATTDDDN